MHIHENSLINLTQRSLVINCWIKEIDWNSSWRLASLGYITVDNFVETNFIEGKPGIIEISNRTYNEQWSIGWILYQLREVHSIRWSK